MEIKFMDVASLVPYVNNPRVHNEKQVEALARSIDSYGFDQPIVVDSSNVIIKGHGRRLAAIKLGLTKVPVVVREVDNSIAKFLRVADNKLVSAQWDEEALSSELKDLQLAGVDIDVTGFSVADASYKTPITSALNGSLDLLVNPEHTCSSCGYRW